MKKIFIQPFLLITCLLCGMMVSCSDDDSPKINDSRLVSKILIEGDAVSQSFTFSYDAQNRIKAVVTNDETLEYIYPDNRSMRIMEGQDSLSSPLHSFALDEKGKCQAAYRGYPKGFIQYGYDAQGLLNNWKVILQNQEQNVDFVWQNGNMTLISPDQTCYLQFSMHRAVMEYSAYDNLTNIDLNAFVINMANDMSFLYQFPGCTSKKLLSSCQFTSPVNEDRIIYDLRLEYSLDSKGYPVSAEMYDAGHELDAHITIEYK